MDYTLPWHKLTLCWAGPCLFSVCTWWKSQGYIFGMGRTAIYSIKRAHAMMYFAKLWLCHPKGFAQDCNKANVLAMELVQSCNKPSICSFISISYIYICLMWLLQWQWSNFERYKSKWLIPKSKSKICHMYICTYVYIKKSMTLWHKELRQHHASCLVKT